MKTQYTFRSKHILCQAIIDKTKHDFSIFSTLFFLIADKIDEKNMTKQKIYTNTADLSLQQMSNIFMYLIYICSIQRCRQWALVIYIEQCSCQRPRTTFENETNENESILAIRYILCVTLNVTMFCSILFCGFFFFVFRSSLFFEKCQIYINSVCCHCSTFVFGLTLSSLKLGYTI